MHIGKTYLQPFKTSFQTFAGIRKLACASCEDGRRLKSRWRLGMVVRTELNEVWFLVKRADKIEFLIITEWNSNICIFEYLFFLPLHIRIG